MSKILFCVWQTVQTKIRCQILRYLIWMHTVCKGLSVPIPRVIIAGWKIVMGYLTCKEIYFVGTNCLGGTDKLVHLFILYYSYGFIFLFFFSTIRAMVSKKKGIIMLAFFCVEVLLPSQPIRVMSSVGSLLNHTFSLQAKCFEGLTSTCVHSFARNWQLPFLHESAEGREWPQKIFHDQSPWKNVAGPSMVRTRDSLGPVVRS